MEFLQWLLFANQPTDRQQYRLREKVHESHLDGDGSVLIVDLFPMENKSPFKTIKSSLSRNDDVPDMQSLRDRSDALTKQKMQSPVLKALAVVSICRKEKSPTGPEAAGAC
ncbi:hypothetical protein T11_8950 [Trichinella zimbabwensis]|uniref:Uncharacterized protein n=1 Tax=Trichinella zimbabwensis TaxID=268475 RepID=A0A0V1HGQ2_9BILA|nr:hypothetical protein T11_8950 [Trichinella zimbabwensis]